MGILEKISEIEKEIARTQKNKGEGGIEGVSPSILLVFLVCKMREQLEPPPRPEKHRGNAEACVRREWAHSAMWFQGS